MYSAPRIALAWVFQKVDNAIQQINHHPVDSIICFLNTYPLDSDLSSGYHYPAFKQLGPEAQGLVT